MAADWNILAALVHVCGPRTHGVAHVADTVATGRL